MATGLIAGIKLQKVGLHRKDEYLAEPHGTAHDADSRFSVDVLLTTASQCHESSHEPSVEPAGPAGGGHTQKLDQNAASYISSRVIFLMGRNNAFKKDLAERREKFDTAPI